VYAILPLALWFVGAGSGNGRSSPSAGCGIQPDPAPWALALVFRRSAAGLRYAGTVRRPRLSTSALKATRAPIPADVAPGRNTASVPADADFEVWMADSGHTTGIWCSSRRRTAAVITAGGAPIPVAGGEIRRLITEAAPAQPAWAPAVVPNAIACYPAPPESLARLCRISQIIAVGEVVGIVRVAHTPVNGTGQIQHVVYALAVEHCLKPAARDSPPLLKVYQQGGWLPWSDDDGRTRGAGYAVINDPPLIVGGRYVLFLDKPDDPLGRDRRRGYVAGSYGNVSGKIAELDEYRAADHWRGKLLISDGTTRFPSASSDETEAHWRFEDPDSPQILDVPEEQALRSIQRAVAAEAAAPR